MKVKLTISSLRPVMAALLVAGMSVLTQSCFSDDFDQTIRFETLPIIPAIPEDDSPVPGNGGIIAAGSITETGVELSWVPGEDELTPQDDLEYRVYLSSGNDISTPALAETNGIVVVDWTRDIVSADAAGLTPGTTYYFIVIVRDGDGNMAAYLTVSATTLSVSDEYPVPGNGGIITTGARSTTEIQLIWTRADDAQTPRAELEYRVYRSDSNNISTPALAEANGTVVLEWTQDTVTAVSDGLTPGTGYYFNVVVRDGDGNMAAYFTVSVTTLTDAMYMFSAGLYAGNLSDATAGSKAARVAVVVPVRDNIDALCEAAKSSTYASLPCLNVRAFISVSPSDDIAGMPANFSVPTGRRIVGPGGTQIVDSWASLLDGAIDTSLGDAAVASDHWWSGSLPDGTFNADNNCGGWTTESDKGRSGLHNKTDSNWIEGNTPNCSASRYVLCVCW